ncbi:MAG: SDR family NAD(P)-dependent oxidoreductase, partial [Anaerolineae bacterium]|nr:SDR family NAD(P)-dependent oxidoreductase [Anaerolineae bacterium]
IRQKLATSTPLTPQKRAILVGASSGIGAALARRLADEGYQIALLARRAEMLETLTNEINLKHGETRAIYYIHDVTDYEAVPKLLKKIIVELGGIDTFIYNAGVGINIGLKSYNFEKDYKMIEINLLGALAWLNPIGEIFQTLKNGQIVGVSSVAGERGRVGSPAYNTSKAALTTYLEAYRNRLTRYGVNVLTVKPGFVQTDLIKNAKKLFWVISPEKAAKDIYEAMQKRKQEIYTPARWRLVMFIVRNTPSFVFRKLSF